MGNQHSSQLRLKPHQLKQKLVGGVGRSKSGHSALSNNVDDQGTAFVCHGNGVMIGKAQFKCTFCSTVKRSAGALRLHYEKRHNLHESCPGPTNTCTEHATQSSPSAGVHVLGSPDNSTAVNGTEGGVNALRARSSYMGGGTVLELLNQYHERDQASRWKSVQTIDTTPTDPATLAQSTGSLTHPLAFLNANGDLPAQGVLTLFVQDRDVIVRCASNDYHRLDSTDPAIRSPTIETLTDDSVDPTRRIVELTRLREQLSQLNRHARLNSMLIGPEVESLSKSAAVTTLTNAAEANDSTDKATFGFTTDATSTIESIRKRAAQRRKSNNSLGLSSDEETDDEVHVTDTHVTVHRGDEDEEDQGQSEETLNGVLSGSSSIEGSLAQASDARCAVCLAHNYVVCIQRRLGTYLACFLLKSLKTCAKSNLNKLNSYN
jgi:hypothetical protein